MSKFVNYFSPKINEDSFLINQKTKSLIIFNLVGFILLILLIIFTFIRYNFIDAIINSFLPIFIITIIIIDLFLIKHKTYNIASNFFTIVASIGMGLQLLLIKPSFFLGDYTSTYYFLFAVFTLSAIFSNIKIFLLNIVIVLSCTIINMINSYKLFPDEYKDTIFSIIPYFLFSLFFATILMYIISYLSQKSINKIEDSAKEINNLNKKLIFHNENLEKIVEQRTTQINTQKEEIQLKNEELQTSNEELTEYKNILNDKNQILSETIEKLKETQSKLIQNEKMASLGILTAGIAHEINNPINFISGGIQSLEENYNHLNNYINECDILSNDLPPKSKEKAKRLKNDNYYNDILTILPNLISNIKTGVKRTEEIVKGLKTFSRIDEAEQKKANIHKSINSALLILKNKYQTDIEIIKNYSNDIEEIICYPGQLNQVFLNLINNAIDSFDDKKEPRTITITTKKANLSDKKEFNISDNHIKISIKDTGVGINKDIIDKIFDPFFTTKEVGKGTGLGLSISHGIIEKHKGNIFVKSTIKEGSEFILFLPKNL